MKVLVGCEESGVVRRAFLARGHDAYSCDMLSARDGSLRHYQSDIMDVLNSTVWDLIIMHPDCTALAVSGNRWYGRGMRDHAARIAALKWTQALWELAKKRAPRVCLENPVGVLELGVEPQWVQPYQFGHGETKKTGLWLHGLSPLVPTNPVDGREQRVWKMPPGPNRKRDRSETYQGIADAMAEQWG